MAVRWFAASYHRSGRVAKAPCTSTTIAAETCRLLQPRSMSGNVPDQAASKPPENALLKLVLEMGPLVAFFLSNSKPEWFRPLLAPVLPASLITGPQSGIFVATAVFMVAMLASLVLTKALMGKLPIMPLVSGVVVLVFGGLTLWLQDDLFIKLKPTIVNTLFGAVLLGGLALGKPLLPYVLDSVFRLTQEGWHKLTFRWGWFFFFLAALNEIVWRMFSTDFWVAFKVWGVMPITIIFAMAQVGILQRYELKDEERPQG
jgi:intracellular septation protein